MAHNGYYIRALLQDEGISIDKIAEAAQCPKFYISQAIHNKRRHPRIRQIIADMLGLPVNALWAENTNQQEAS